MSKHTPKLMTIRMSDAEHTAILEAMREVQRIYEKAGDTDDTAITDDLCERFNCVEREEPVRKAKRKK